MTPQIRRILKQQLDITDRGLLLTPKYESWLMRHGGEFVLSPIEAARFGDMMADHLSRVGRVREGAFSASSRGYCERAQVFGYMGLPQRPHGDSLLSLIFIDGKMKHLVWQFIGLEAGALSDIEVPVDDSAFKTWRMKGSMDGIEAFNGIGLELKSTMAFNYYVKDGPSHAHKLQVHSYFEGRDDIDVFCVVYLDVTTRNWKEYVITRDPQYVAMVRNELERLNHAIDHRQLPEVLDECKAGKGKTFQGCQYSHICLGCRSYSDAERIRYSAGQ